MHSYGETEHEPGEVIRISLSARRYGDKLIQMPAALTGDVYAENHANCYPWLTIKEKVKTLLSSPAFSTEHDVVKEVHRRILRQRRELGWYYQEED